jgi:hypothetical protein
MKNYKINFSLMQFNGQVIKGLKTIAIICCTALLFSCATSGSSILVGNKRPAINPTEVKLYLEPPTKYEIIGLVESVCGNAMTRQAAQNNAINYAKKLAAQMGANGIILTGSGSEPTVGSGTISGNTISLDQGVKFIARGEAIFVIEE